MSPFPAALTPPLPTSAAGTSHGPIEQRAARIVQITWPIIRERREERLTWHILIEPAPAAANDNAWVITRAESATSSLGVAVAPVHSASFEPVGQHLWHVEVPGFLAAVLRMVPGQFPTLLYARTPLLDAETIPAGAADRPQVAVRPS